MLEVDDRVVMISGASRGIGRAMAVGLLAKGYLLSLGARRPEMLADIGRDGAEKRVLAVAYDALDAASAGAWVDATLARFGRIDALINNAGACATPPSRTAGTRISSICGRSTRWGRCA